MALKATIFRADLEITDLDRHYYASHNIHLAQHPSETLERLLVRLLAFCIHADPKLECSADLSSEDSPALQQLELTGEIKTWIDVGQPDEKRLRKACRRARNVILYCYGNQRILPWWQQQQASLSKLKNLRVEYFDSAELERLLPLVRRSMHIHCTLQDQQLWLTQDDISAGIQRVIWQA